LIKIYVHKERNMKEVKQTKAQLEKRRGEIEKQLNLVNQNERIKLDNDIEEQAIEMEQHEVSVTMEENLRKELNQIEDKLLVL
jgi:RNA polymerase-binding transcription factor DksA